MKDLMENFKEFLTEDKERKGRYDQGGTMTLYHYAMPDEESLVLDPKYKRGSYSTREYEVADTPRVFFYVDPDHRERFFLNRRLYKVDVPTNRVYDLGEDPEDPRGLYWTSQSPGLWFTERRRMEYFIRNHQRKL